MLHKISRTFINNVHFRSDNYGMSLSLTHPFRKASTAKSPLPLRWRGGKFFLIKQLLTTLAEKFVCSLYLSLVR